MMVADILILFQWVVDDLNTDTRRTSDLQVDVPVLIRQAQHGDREAVGLLYRAFAHRIYRYIYFRVPTHSDAEDLTAEVFVRMVQGLPTYQITEAPFEAWLYRIAASRVADFFRSRQQVTELDDVLAETLANDEAAPEDRVEAQQAISTLRTAIRQLPPEQQNILIWRFIERKSHEEVAELLGKSVTAVKTAQHRALLRLTELMGGEQKVRHYLRGAHD